MISLHPANSVTKIFVITVKGFEPTTQLPLVLDTKLLPQHQQDTFERQDLYIEPNSCFRDLSDSLNLLNSVNFYSIKGKLQYETACDCSNTSGIYTPLCNISVPPKLVEKSMNLHHLEKTLLYLCNFFCKNIFSVSEIFLLKYRCLKTV